MTDMEYRVPHGTMHVNADEFFRTAGLRQVQRMLKQLAQDWDAAEKYAPLIREYLAKARQDAEAAIALGAARVADARTKCAEAKTRYAEMKSPCYACYTRDKEALAAERAKVKELNDERLFAERYLDDAERPRRRYGTVQGYVDTILGGGPGC